jgi:hypothetical protein
MTSVQSFLDTLGPEIEDAEEGKLEYLFPTSKSLLRWRLGRLLGPTEFLNLSRMVRYTAAYCGGRPMRET